MHSLRVRIVHAVAGSDVLAALHFHIASIKNGFALAYLYELIYHSLLRKVLASGKKFGCDGCKKGKVC